MNDVIITTTPFVGPEQAIFLMGSEFSISGLSNILQIMDIRDTFIDLGRGECFESFQYGIA